MSYILEISVDSVKSALAAQEAGAKRIELCANGIIGGTSPGEALYKQVKAHTDLEVRVLLRPRFGDFCYDQYEFEVLKEEAQMFSELGADGIVIGILKPDGTLNVEQMKELIRLGGDREMTLHRAFDVCKNPYEAMEQAIEMGIGTILTSGQENTAWEGRELLKELYKRSAGRIDILAGAGVNADGIAKLAAYTGVTSYHMSGKSVLESSMQYRKEGVSMGLPGFSEFEIWQTDVEKVKKAVEICYS